MLPFDSLARCYTGDTLRFAEERGQDDAESHRGDVGFLLHCAGDGGWSGLAGHPLLGAGELLMQARQIGGLSNGAVMINLTPHAAGIRPILLQSVWRSGELMRGAMTVTSNEGSCCDARSASVRSGHRSRVQVVLRG